MSVKFKKGIDVNNSPITGLADGSNPTDAVTLQQLQAMVRGLDWKTSVRVASTANVAVASGLTNGSTMDGVTLATGDRVLLKNQTTGSENGIYVVVASGAASRANDADSSAEVTSGLAVTATEGTANGDKTWVLTTNDPITLGTTSLSFSQLGGAAGGGYATIMEDGSSLTQRTTLNFATGLVATDDSGNTRTNVNIDTTLVVRKFAQDCAATTNPQTFTHALGTDVQVEVWEGSERVFPDITKSATSGGQVTIDWGGAPTAAQYRVVVNG